MNQIRFIRCAVPELFVRKLKYRVHHIVNAILYLLKTGCLWKMLPASYPNWRCVYHHFRSWTERGYIDRLLVCLAEWRRSSVDKPPCPQTIVTDSQSVRWGTIYSEKGIDGNKKVKGIKRHVCVDSDGYPLSVHVTTANIHDTKAANKLWSNALKAWPEINRIKADNGYRGKLQEIFKKSHGVDTECVKSNFGTSAFIPIDGRWVVERFFSWLEGYRRMMRNYEVKLTVARNMTVFACVAMLLKHIV